MSIRHSRRTVLGAFAALAGAASTGALAHTPYRQWVVYRQKHLLVGAHRGDPQTYALAQTVVEALERELPAASARIARGPRPQRIASLMGTSQLRVAVLSEDEAAAMAEARAPFENYRPTPLRRVAALTKRYSLFAIPDLPDEHGWLLAEALAHAGLARQPLPGAIALHAGAAAYWNGAPRPG
ncbi:MAG: hypothetical protein AAF899_01330 [Pseudomonadota bacterium]